MYNLLFLHCDEPKSGLARDLGDRLESRNVYFGIFGNYVFILSFKIKKDG